MAALAAARAAAEGVDRDPRDGAIGGIGGEEAVEVPRGRCVRPEPPQEPPLGFFLKPEGGVRLEPTDPPTAPPPEGGGDLKKKPGRSVSDTAGAARLRSPPGPSGGVRVELREMQSRCHCAFAP